MHVSSNNISRRRIALALALGALGLVGAAVIGATAVVGSGSAQAAATATVGRSAVTM